MSFSPDGQTIACSTTQKIIKLWSVSTGEEILTILGHSDWIHSLAFSPDGKNIVSGGYDKTVKVWQMPWQ